jgi:RNA polymerase sigma-70 factor, ECF subfamily
VTLGWASVPEMTPEPAGLRFGMMAASVDAGFEGAANGVGPADIKRAMAPAVRSIGASADAIRHVRLWDEHAQRIYRYCFRRTADREQAEDLTSIVFLEAWRRRDKVELAADAELPWLYGIAANVVRNQRRKQRRYRAALARLPRPRDETDLAQDAVDHLADQEQMRLVVARLRVLPQIEQDVLTLCAWEDLTPKEAAVALGVPESTVRTRLYRARNRLRLPDEAKGHTPVPGVPRVEGEGS